MAKRAPDTVLVTTAARVGRALGRVAKGFDEVRMIGTRAAPAKRRRSPPKTSKKFAEVAASTAKARTSWTAQEEGEKALVASRTGRSVDERALAHAKDGKRWAARKTR